MTKVVGYSSEEDFRRAANVIRYVERGGIDHPYYRRQAPMGEEGCDCCDEVADLDILTEYIGTGSSTSLMYLMPAYFDFTFPNLQSAPFRLWFRADSNPADPYTTRAISDQFAVDYLGSSRIAHWEFTTNWSASATNELCRIALVLDTPIRHNLTTSSLFSYAKSRTGMTGGLFDFLSQHKLSYANRHAILSSLAPGDTAPLAVLPSHLCLTPQKYPDSIETDSPLTQLWGGTPPASLYVSLNGGAPSTIGYILSGKLDFYGASPWRYGLRAVMNGDEVDTTKVMLMNMGTNSPSMLNTVTRTTVVDFASPLDVTVTDSVGDTLRFYE